MTKRKIIIKKIPLLAILSKPYFLPGWLVPPSCQVDPTNNKYKYLVILDDANTIPSINVIISRQKKKKRKLWKINFIQNHLIFPLFWAQPIQISGDVIKSIFWNFELWDLFLFLEQVQKIESRSITELKLT